MARIGVLGFLHETNTFASDVTTLERFIEADAWPGLTEGQAILPATDDMNLAISGFIAEIRQLGEHEIVPLLWCSANPSGPVADAAFEHIVGRMETLLKDAGPLDALFLDLHGSMVTQSLDDAEGELLRRLRAITGDAMPYVAALDFHAIISQAMVDQTDMMVAYRSYPHVDMADTGARAARQMQQLLTGATRHAAWKKLDFLVSMPWQCTLGESPAGKVMELALSLQDEQCPEVQFIPGFPLSDTPQSGPAVLVYATDETRAEQALQTLVQQVEQLQDAFTGSLYTPSQAVARLDQAQRIILADTQDNPGGGGAGDTTAVARALLEAQVTQACVAVMCDADFAEKAHQAGVGAVLDEPLAGRSFAGDSPLAGPFDVLALGSGEFVGTGPFYRGCRMELGRMARVRQHGVEFLVSSRKQQAADQAMFHHLGAKATDYRVLVLKSSVHFRADFAELADQILMVKAPGANTADLNELEFKRLRPGVHIY